LPTINMAARKSMFQAPLCSTASPAALRSTCGGVRYKILSGLCIIFSIVTSKLSNIFFQNLEHDDATGSTSHWASRRTSGCLDFLLLTYVEHHGLKVRPTSLRRPEGGFCPYECTTGLLKADDKVSLLIDRAERVRQGVVASNNQHLRVLPVIIS